MSNFVVFRLQHSVPLALNSKDEVDKFFDGSLPKLAKTATDIAVVGMFLDKNNKGKSLLNMDFKGKTRVRNCRTLFRAFHCHSLFFQLPIIHSVYPQNFA